MLHYILQIIAFQTFFLLVYDLFLKKETFFNWNRTYLLTTSILSFVLPFVKIKALQESIPQQFIISLPEIVISNESNLITDGILLDTILITHQSVSYMQWLFYIGLSVALLLFVMKLYKIVRLIYKNPKTKNQGVRVVNLLKSNTAFSFLNYIFIGDTISKEEVLQIIEHEKVHVQHRHTLDLLYFEVLRIVFWFNPLIYIYQSRMAELHEFIADSKAVKEESKTDYYQNLLAQIFDTKKVSFINTFFKQSLIKKRIIMLSKEKSKTILKLKYTLLIPLVFGMLVYTSCSQNNEVESFNAINKIQGKESTLINKIRAVHTQIEVQGNISDHELKGLGLLLETIKGDEKNVNLIKEIHDFEATKNQSPLTSKIAAVFKQIQVQGNISEEEKNALEDFLVLVSPDGMNDPFFQDAVERGVEIPFAVISQVPIFPGCETGTNEEQKKCMSKKISNIVGENFNTKLGDDLKLKGKVKIYVTFKIDKQGNVIDVKSKAPHKELEAEAERVVKLLPKMKPGQHKGKDVIVPYSLPIMFQIHD